jgi:tetratricopeptide (TPR) repeat protein
MVGREVIMTVFSTFNPSAMPQRLIEGSFVQREEIAQRLVSIFEESAQRDSKHNVLLIGPRGIGKSHLTTLVYHRLKAKAHLADKLCIAYLKEDEWGINSFLDLLLRVHRAASEESGDRPPEPSKAFPDLWKLTRSDAEDHVWRRLREMLKKRTLLLIIENLDAVFEKIGEQGQKQWRALMQTYPQWAMLATTPALFSGISRQVSPFYGFFEIIHLQPLSFDDAIALLRRLADLNGDDKTAAMLETPVGRARVRAVQHIAGGNHRIFVLFYDFLSQSGSDRFVEPLVKTIDALTPYYQSHMAGLSNQQQKIINFLCEHRKPATVTAIAENCFASHQTTAAQLKLLLSSRYVRVDRVGRESYYELTEPLLRICVEAKTHSERPLHLLVDFIRYWFTREELEHKLSDANDRDISKLYFLAALQEYDVENAHAHLDPEIAPLCRALTRANDAPEALKKTAHELAELSKRAEDWPHYSRAMLWLDKADEAIPVLKQQFVKHPQNVEILRSLAGLYGERGMTEPALNMIDRAIKIRPNQAVLFFDKGDLLAGCKRYEEALEAYDQAAPLDPDLRPLIAVSKARTLLKLAKFPAARETLQPFLSSGKVVPGLLRTYGLALANEHRLEDALEYFNQASSAFENDPFAWGNKGVALCELEKYPEAVQALDRAISLGSSNKLFLHNRCEALLKTGQFSLASASVPPEILAHSIFHRLLELSKPGLGKGELKQKLLALKGAESSRDWQDAFAGSLSEFASFASKEFTGNKDLEELKTWSSVLQDLFSGQEEFSIPLKLLEVIIRVRIDKDKKALLELPLEQRLLLTTEESVHKKGVS